MDTLSTLVALRAQYEAEIETLNRRSHGALGCIIWQSAIDKLDESIGAEIERLRSNPSKPYFRIVNSKGDQIGALLDSFHDAETKVNAMAKDKRGLWVRYNIETVVLTVVATNKRAVAHVVASNG